MAGLREERRDDVSNGCVLMEGGLLNLSSSLTFRTVSLCHNLWGS